MSEKKYVIEEDIQGCFIVTVNGVRVAGPFGIKSAAEKWVVRKAAEDAGA